VSVFPPTGGKEGKSYEEHAAVSFPQQIHNCKDCPGT